MASDETPLERIDRLLAESIPRKVKPEVLLAELDELIRNRPTPGEIQAREATVWLGRAAAVLGHHADPRINSVFNVYVDPYIYTGHTDNVVPAYSRLLALLNEARHSISIATAGLLNVAIAPGMVFDYFDEVRKIVERATVELFFVDPYLDADFVSRYLAFAPSGVAIRLLAGTKTLATLLPAIDAFAKQRGAKVAVRSTDKHHDRYVFVDGKECFQSGASFKDGGKAPTTLTQITDAFPAMLQTYEALWAAGKVER